MQKVILWLADTMGFTVDQAADLVVISLGVFAGSFVALCLSLIHISEPTRRS